MKAPGGRSTPFKPRILVVGGGPAGSAAAIWCTKFGLPVTIIEGSRFPRDRPGEGLHPGIDAIFTQLGISNEIHSAGFLRYPGTWVQWEGNPEMVSFGVDKYGPWLGYQVWRADLDELLLNHARKMGAVIIQPCQAYEVLLEANRVIGIKTSMGEYRADFMIDAAGSGHWLARKLNINIERHSPPLYVHYGYAEGNCAARDLVPAIVSIPGGWIWTAKVREHVYQWIRLMFKKSSLSHDWLPLEFQRLKPLRHARGADVTWRLVTRPSGLGYFIAGDASAVMDPASSHGILRALMSGIMAAHTIVQITKYHFQEQLASVQYNEWLSKWFLHDVTKLKNLYTRHPDRPSWSFV